MLVLEYLQNSDLKMYLEKRKLEYVYMESVIVASRDAYLFS